MNFTAPSGSVMVLRDSVQINPAVSGTVTHIEITSGKIVEEGSLLFQIDSDPYLAKTKATKARLDLASKRLEQAKELTLKKLGREFDVQTYEAEVNQLAAELDVAKFLLMGLRESV